MNGNTINLGSKLPNISNGHILVSPHYYNTILSVAQTTQAPYPIILSSMLSAMSAVCQGIIDVKKPSGQTVPSSMYFLTIAESGERKSTVHNTLWHEIIKHDQREQELTKDQVKKTESLLTIWDQKHKKLTRCVAELDFDDIENTDEFEKLLKHESMKPKVPSTHRIIYEDATSSALFLGMNKNNHNAALVSSEGGSILNGNNLRDLPKINSIWSGDHILVDRSSTESFSLVDARLTVSIMIQRAAFDKYIVNHGDEAKGIGLWARFMICESYSTQGSRFINNLEFSPECKWFNERITALLAENKIVANHNRPRKVLEFDPIAKQNWIKWHNDVESQVYQGGAGLLERASDFGSKLADNVARLAGLLHYFEKGDGESLIDTSTLESAISICKWYTAEFVYLRLLPEQADRDINTLQGWLVHILNENRVQLNPHIFVDQQSNSFCLRKNFVRQYAPNQLRERERLNKTLREMQSLGIIQLFKGMDKVNYLSLAPDIFGKPY